MMDGLQPRTTLAFASTNEPLPSSPLSADSDFTTAGSISANTFDRFCNVVVVAVMEGGAAAPERSPSADGNDASSPFPQPVGGSAAGSALASR